ncbi:hypothetical protein [Pedobacter immunditicola]|uniref:hypothetical protein n=1 Tax=Pedobacter immunditicola TaxID=3133440 RepID=UPI0030A0FB9E
METIYKMARLNTRIHEQALTDHVGLAAMRALEEELNRLSSLFVRASFVLAEQDFQNLSHLQQNHSALKMEMSTYFQRLKSYTIGGIQMFPNPQAEMNPQLKNELQELISRFQQFKNKLFTLKSSTRFLG